MHTADTPAEAEKYFWDDVDKLLTAPHGRFCHSPQVANEGIEKYKDRRRGEHGIPEAVYNQGEERTAEIIDSVIRHGLRESS